MQALLGAIISSLGFGSANVVIKKALEDVSISKTLFMSFFSGSITLLGYLLITQSFEPGATADLLTPLGLAIIEIILYLCLYKSFATSNVTIATALIGLYPILVTIVSVVFLQADSSVKSWLFIIVMIGGALLVSIDWAGIMRNGFDSQDLSKGLNWILLTMAAHAVYFPLLGVYTSTGGLISKLLLVKLSATALFFVIYTVWLRHFPFPVRGKILPLSLLGLLEVVGWVGFSWATIADVSQVGLVSAALNFGAVVTAILAFVVLKEKLKPLQYVGIAIIVVALILQNL